MYRITLLGSDSTFNCKPGEKLLLAMIRQGGKAIPVGCRNGGCGVCKVRVHEGSHEHGKMSRAHISVEEEAAGFVLSCRCVPTSDLTVEVVGEFPRRRRRPDPAVTTTNHPNTL